MITYLPRICKHCGKEFETRRSYPTKQYCCTECLVEGQRVYKSCLQCGVRFHAKDGKKFCGHDCAKEFHKVGDAVGVVCEECGIEFEVAGYMMRNRPRRFCSADCSSVWTKKNLSKNGVSGKNRKRSISTKLRQRVWWNDAQTCQYCRRDDQRLTLDHIIPESKGGVEEFWNLITCCMECNSHKRDVLMPRKRAEKLVGSRLSSMTDDEVVGLRERINGLLNEVYGLNGLQMIMSTGLSMSLVH